MGALSFGQLSGGPPKVGEVHLRKSRHLFADCDSVRILSNKFEGLKVADGLGRRNERGVRLSVCCVYGYWFEGEGETGGQFNSFVEISTDFSTEFL